MPFIGSQLDVMIFLLKGERVSEIPLPKRICVLICLAVGVAHANSVDVGIGADSPAEIGDAEGSIEERTTRFKEVKCVTDPVAASISEPEFIVPRCGELIGCSYRQCVGTRLIFRFSLQLIRTSNAWRVTEAEEDRSPRGKVVIQPHTARVHMGRKSTRRDNGIAQPRGLTGGTENFLAKRLWEFTEYVDHRARYRIRSTVRLRRRTNEIVRRGAVTDLGRVSE
jgi:hypothetical protein